MAGLLDDGATVDEAPPADLTTLATTADTAPAAPSAGQPAAPADDPNDIGWLAKVGLALGGGPAGIATLTPEQRRDTGTHAMLNFGLALLRDSGWSTERKTAGQILAGGLSAAEQTSLEAEAASARQTALSADYALKKGDQDLKRKMLALGIAKLGLPQTLATAAGGALGFGPGGKPAATAGGAPAGLTPFVAPDLPDGITPQTDQIVRTVIGEAGNEPEDGQRAVAHVIANRAKSSGMSTQDVIFAGSQFEPWNNPATRAKLEGISPGSPQYQRVLATIRPVLDGTDTDPTGGADHFYAPKVMTQRGQAAGPDWAQGQTGQDIGGHRFYKLGYAPGGASPALVQAPGAAPGTAPAQVAGPGAPSDASGTPPPPAPPRAPGSAAPPGSSPRPFPADILAGLDDSIRAAVASGHPESVTAANEKKQAALIAWNEKEQDRLHAEAAETQKHQNALDLSNHNADQRAKEEQAKQRFELDKQQEQLRGEAAKNRDTHALQVMQDRLKLSNVTASAARGQRDATDQLELLLPSLGGANPIAQQLPKVRDWAVGIGLGTKDQADKWTAGQTFDAVLNRFAPGMRPAGSGTTSDKDMTLYRQSFPQLSQTQEGRLITLGMLRASADRNINEDNLRTEYYSMPGSTPAGMERYVDSRLPPLVAKPPAMVAAALKPDASAEDKAAALATDRTALTNFEHGQPDGMPFQTWGRVKGADGGYRRVPIWAINTPDGRTVYEPGRGR